MRRDIKREDAGKPPTAMEVEIGGCLDQNTMAFAIAGERSTGAPTRSRPGAMTTKREEREHGRATEKLARREERAGKVYQLAQNLLRHRRCRLLHSL